MTTSVIIPWKPGDLHREAALAYVIKRYADEHPELEVIIGQHDPEAPWSKAIAVREGLKTATGDLLVLADADVFTDGLDRAIERVAAGTSRWAVPHTTVIRLSEGLTRRVLDGAPPRATETDRRPYRGIVGGGLTVIDRRLYEEAPLDARFVGWGHEDQSAGLMWRCLVGEPWRGSANLWHLWHPPQPKLSQAVGSRESKLLLERYRKAAKNPEQMRSLVSEGLQVLG